MWQTLGLSFLAGLFASNGVPHFVKGITKENFPCLFGNSPVPNLVAGWAMFVLAAWLAYYAHVDRCPVASFMAGAVGALLIGLFHAWHGAFGRKSQ